MQGDNLQAESPLICTHSEKNTSKPLTYSRYDVVIKDLGKRIGVPDMTPYCLRRGAATAIVAAGATSLEKDIYMRHNIFSLSAYLRTPSTWAGSITQQVIKKAIEEANVV